MSTYLKHMGGYTYKQLKGKSFDEIQKFIDKEMKRVNTFCGYGYEVQERKKNKRRMLERKTTKGNLAERRRLEGKERNEQHKESLKNKKEGKEKESEEVDEIDKAELKKLLVIKRDGDIAIDSIPLATKLPVIIDYKLHKEDKEDLEALWRIVKAKYGDTRPDNEFERVLWGDLKVMFEPDKRSDVWRILQGYRVTIWKLIDSFGVHFVSKRSMKGLNASSLKYDEDFKEENLKIQKMNTCLEVDCWGLKRTSWILEVTNAQVICDNCAKCAAGEKITIV
ncbi:hypothetical protein Tco_0268319 [Tanacetum coccineum]